MTDSDNDSLQPPHSSRQGAKPGIDVAVASNELAPADGTHDAARPEHDSVDDIASQVEQPAKVMRIGTMVKQLLEEVRQAPLDEAGRRRLREIHESSIEELSAGISAELRDELARLSLPFGGETPSEAELRVAQAQLVGWLEGLFHGIQTAIYAQQAAARAQLEEMAGRRGLPSARQVVVGPDGQLLMPPGAGGPPDAGEDGPTRGTGQYL